jgi:AcrR family transcriptional regulator
MKDITISSAEIRGERASGEIARRGNRTTRVPEILEVAINVFASEGSAGFTLRRIAHDAGIRLRTLQHYFGTRDELVRCTIEEMVKRNLELYRSLARDKQLPPEARLERIVDATFAALTGPGSILSAFAFECWCLAEHEAFVDDLMKKVSEEFQAMFADLVAKINPTLPSGECALRGALLLLQWQGLIVFTRRRGDSAPDTDALRVATKAVWRALSTPQQ